jgi:ATP-dependent DNA helicase RecQ
VTPASTDFDGFNPSDFDSDYQAGGRFSSEPAGLVLPQRPGPFADPLEALQTVWGYQAFRPGQREIIDTILAGQNLLVVAATSFGKSLTFQLPSLMRRDRPVLVVSPLIALMRNQVDDARSRGIPTVMVNSRLTRQEKEDSLAAIRRGKAALIYVAPEGLDNFVLRQAMAYCPPWLVAADEVHSVVESGLSYRPAYRFIQEMLAERHTEAPQWLTVTASATAATLADVQSRLGLEQAQVTGCVNLAHAVRAQRLGHRRAVAAAEHLDRPHHQ